MNKQCCGTCVHHIPMPLNEWVCDNPDSEDYGLETDYSHSCEDYESKGGS